MKSLVLIALSILVCSNFHANASEDVNKGSFSQIPPQVLESAKIFNFPDPKFKELGMVAFTQENPTSVSYGHYRVNEVSSGVTNISSAATQTFETQDVAYNLFLRGFLDEGRTLKHELRSNGSGASVGGLIELLALNQINIKVSNNLKHSMTIESKVTKLEFISGQLFPLKVGNKLIIQLSSKNSIENGKNRKKTLEFEVTKLIKDYLLNTSELPGNVFEITIHSEQSKKGISLPPKFLFSSHLGWIVESHIGNVIEKVVGWN